MASSVAIFFNFIAVLSDFHFRKERLSAPNFEILLNFLIYSISKSNVARQLMRQVVHALSGDNNLLPLFFGEGKLF